MAPHNRRDFGITAYCSIKDYKTCGYLRTGSISWLVGTRLTQVSKRMTHRLLVVMAGLVWGIGCQVLFSEHVASLCSTGSAIPSSRPGRGKPPRAVSVKDGRRPPPEAARSVLDGREHGGTIVAEEDAAALPFCHHPGRPPLAQAKPACKLVSGGTFGFHTMMPYSSGLVGGQGGRTNLDGGVLQP